MAMVPLVAAKLGPGSGFRAELMPPVDVLTEPMFPAVGGVSFTKGGLVLETYGPLPIHLGLADVGSVGLLGALLIPKAIGARQLDAKRPQKRN